MGDLESPRPGPSTQKARGGRKCPRPCSHGGTFTAGTRHRGLCPSPHLSLISLARGGMDGTCEMPVGHCLLCQTESGVQTWRTKTKTTRGRTNPLENFCALFVRVPLFEVTFCAVFKLEPKRAASPLPRGSAAHLHQPLPEARRRRLDQESKNWGGVKGIWSPKSGAFQWASL